MHFGPVAGFAENSAFKEEVCIFSGL